MNPRHTGTKAQKRKLGRWTMQQSDGLLWKPDFGQAGDCRMPPGSLIRHSTQRMGKP